MPESGEPTLEGIDLSGLREYLVQTEVRFAILFGSYARDTADRNSDVDIALRFPDEMDAYKRFHSRNRIDADLQEYAPGFVDVSDIETLPNPVAHAALRDGIILVGDEQAVRSYQKRVKAEYDATLTDRERERREFIDRLARGDV